MTRIVKFTDSEAMAILGIANALDAVEPRPRRGSQMAYFDSAANRVDEAGANQERNIWDRCPKCKGAGVIEDDA